MVVGYRKDLNAGQRPAVEYGVKAGSRSTIGTLLVVAVSPCVD